MPESSHGKMRPSLPRARELHIEPRTADERRRDHQSDGRFGAGNAAARGRGWKGAITKLLGSKVENVDEAAAAVAADAWRTFCESLRELPSDGPIVRGLAALRARHEALAGFWSARAASVGLASDAGIKAQEMAMKHGQRAERLAVTVLDVATALAKADPRDPDAVPPGYVRVD